MDEREGHCYSDIQYIPTFLVFLLRITRSLCHRVVNAKSVCFMSAFLARRNRQPDDTRTTDLQQDTSVVPRQIGFKLNHPGRTAEADIVYNCDRTRIPSQRRSGLRVFLPASAMRQINSHQSESIVASLDLGRFLSLLLPVQANQLAVYRYLVLYLAVSLSFKSSREQTRELIGNTSFTYLKH